MPGSRFLCALGVLACSCTPSPQSTAGTTTGEPTAASSGQPASPAVPLSASGVRPSAKPPDAPAGGGATAAASAGTTPASGAPLPPLSEVRRIRLEREQGGPSIRRCGGRAYDVELDLVANTWVSRLCHPDTQGPPANEPLTRSSGKLLAPSRAEVERVYATLRHAPARGCGKDGGTLRLIVTLRDGKTERWVDENWGCVQPPPQAIEGLDALRIVAMAAAHDEP